MYVKESQRRKVIDKNAAESDHTFFLSLIAWCRSDEDSTAPFGNESPFDLFSFPDYSPTKHDPVEGAGDDRSNAIDLRFDRCKAIERLYMPDGSSGGSSVLIG